MLAGWATPAIITGPQSPKIVNCGGGVGGQDRLLIIIIDWLQPTDRHTNLFAPSSRFVPITLQFKTVSLNPSTALDASSVLIHFYQHFAAHRKVVILWIRYEYRDAHAEMKFIIQDQEVCIWYSFHTWCVLNFVFVKVGCCIKIGYNRGF